MLVTGAVCEVYEINGGTVAAVIALGSGYSARAVG
jgi:hypothetical protein